MGSSPANLGVETQTNGAERHSHQTCEGKPARDPHLQAIDGGVDHLPLDHRDALNDLAREIAGSLKAR